MSNLPPGVTVSMLPGNSAEEIEWERMLEALADSGMTAAEILHCCGLDPLPNDEPDDDRE